MTDIQKLRNGSSLHAVNGSNNRRNRRGIVHLVKSDAAARRLAPKRPTGERREPRSEGPARDADIPGSGAANELEAVYLPVERTARDSRFVESRLGNRRGRSLEIRDLVVEELLWGNRDSEDLSENLRKFRGIRR
jgi:hypothetical protein